MKHDAEIDPEHPANREDVITEQDEKDALHQRKEREGSDLRKNVIVQADVEVALALQDGAVANDVVRTIR